MKPDFFELFRALGRAGVEHVVVGGVAAILEGAPITTLDLDIVCRHDDDNFRRLADLLEGLEARYRDPAGRDIRPTQERLENNKINLLETRLGPLDVMQSIGPGWSWHDLVERSRVLKVGDLEVRVPGGPCALPRALPGGGESRPYKWQRDGSRRGGPCALRGADKPRAGILPYVGSYCELERSLARD